MNLDLSNVLNFINGTNGQSKKTFTVLENTLDFSASVLDSSEAISEKSKGIANVDADKIFDMLNVEQDPDVKDDILDCSEFSEYFSLENTGISKSQVQELFDLMSSLDGEIGISKDELKQVMDLSQKDGFSSSDIEAFLTQIKEELGLTTTIVAGQSPTSLMKMIEGSDGKFNSEDYAALIKMNIQAGNIKEDDVKMTDSQKQKYGVDYMLHPGMNLKLYSQAEINKYKEDNHVTSNDGTKESDGAQGNGQGSASSTSATTAAPDPQHDSFSDKIINDNTEKYGKAPSVVRDANGYVLTVAVGKKGTGNYHVFDIKNKSVTYYGTNNKPTVTYSNINSEGKVTDKSIVTSYTYNDDGATVQTNKDLNGNLISSEKYDKNGDLLNSVIWSDDGVTYKSETIRESAINGSVDSYKFKSDTDAYEAMKQNGNNPIAIVKKSDKEVYFAIGDKLFDLSGRLVE